MPDQTDFDVVIIGGSFAGLSAALALVRSLRKVLIIDSGNPCNKQTPYTHNFLAHDGDRPADLLELARKQILTYPTVVIENDFATTAKKANDHFFVNTMSGKRFTSKKMLLATGVADIMPSIPGFDVCWGVSVLHCPYCHGYEVRNKKIGLLVNDQSAFEHARFLRHWFNDLTVFTNNTSVLSDQQEGLLTKLQVSINHEVVEQLIHENGYVKAIVLEKGNSLPLHALFAKVAFKQHNDIAAVLGCNLNDTGHIQVDMFQKTSEYGIYAAGDCTSMFRSVANATAAGNIAGAMINKEMIDEELATELRSGSEI